jgi:hypothetical protein
MATRLSQDIFQLLWNDNLEVQRTLLGDAL